MDKKIEQSLGRDEKIVGSAKMSAVVLVPHLILCCFLIGFITIWKPLIGILTTKLCFTNKKVIGKVGFIKIQTLDAPLNKINNVGVSQGFFGRIFKYGTVRIDTSSGTYLFNYVVKPSEFKSALMRQIDEFGENKASM